MNLGMVFGIISAAYVLVLGGVFYALRIKIKRLEAKDARRNAKLDRITRRHADQLAMDLHDEDQVFFDGLTELSRKLAANDAPRTSG